MKPGQQVFAISAQLSQAEHQRVHDLAALERLSVSDFVRRCVNAYIVELEDDGLLLAEQAERRGRPRKEAA